MEIKNIERAKELIPEMEALKEAKSLLSDESSDVVVINGETEVVLPDTLRMNILNVINCEYERVRKEIREL